MKTGSEPGCAGSGSRTVMMKGLADRVILLWGWQRTLTAFAAGALAALAQAPFDFFAACFIAFPVLVWLLHGISGGHDSLLRRLAAFFTTGWWFGFGYFLTGLWWVGNALLVGADAHAWALPFALFGLPALLAMFYGFAALLARCLWSDGIGRIAALAFAFALAEWLRSVVLTGFPWNAIGYAAMPTTLAMQSAKITGLFGMSALAVFVFASPALLTKPRKAGLGISIAGLLIFSHLLYGYLVLNADLKAEKHLQVRIVQPSIDQAEKWDATVRDRIFATLIDMTGSASRSGELPPELIVWPETAVPFLFEERPEALSELASVLTADQLLVTGAVRTEAYDEPDKTRYYNSAVVIGPDGAIIDAVDKSHLVPFGEYVPLANLLKAIGVEHIVQSAGPFSSGTSGRTLAVAEGIRALPFICYEIIFPHHLNAAAGEADLLLNLTNDAWFGVTPGPYQHFRQARLRAVETGLPLIRAANNGLSAVIDAQGRIIDAFALNAIGVLDVSLPLQRKVYFVWGDPGTNGLMIALLFFGVAISARFCARLRAN